MRHLRDTLTVAPPSPARPANHPLGTPVPVVDLCASRSRAYSSFGAMLAAISTAPVALRQSVTEVAY